MLSFFFRHGLVVTINSTDEASAKARAEEIAVQRFKDEGLTEEPSLSGVATLPKDNVVVTWDRKGHVPTQAEINLVQALTAGVQANHLPLADADAREEWNIDARMAERQMIDMTPAHLKTQEGAKRVNDTLRAFDDSAAELANEAMRFIDNWAGLVRSLVNAGGTTEDKEGLNEGLSELEQLAEQRRAAQENFLRAVTGK